MAFKSSSTKSFKFTNTSNYNYCGSKLSINFTGKNNNKKKDIHSEYSVATNKYKPIKLTEHIIKAPSHQIKQMKSSSHYIHRLGTELQSYIS